MGRRRNRGRSVNGILLLDKPGGMTSNGALQKVKRLFDANKAGHTGSLDPIATGVLPICLGEATKMSAFLLDADKGYRVTVKLGVKTTSGDTEGDVVSERPVPTLDEGRIEEVLNHFKGPIDQVPPMHSAIKRDGQPLYKLAHQGIEIEREARQICIHELKLISYSEDSLELDVLCSKGTYIRVLAEDIGEMLGCGGHVTVLRRTVAGPFRLEDCLTLDSLESLKESEGLEALDRRLLPLDAALAQWPEVSLSEDMVYFLKRGQAIQVPKAPTAGMVKLYGASQGFLGVGYILDDGRVAPKRLLNL